MNKDQKSKADSKNASESPKSSAELLKEYRFKSNLLKIQHEMGNLPSQQTHQLRVLRKEIARLLTKINDKSLK
jgi:ribosomal protein L29